jgi:hypothetical protein
VPQLIEDFWTNCSPAGPGVPRGAVPAISAAIWLCVSAVSKTRNRDIEPLKNASRISFDPVPPRPWPLRCLAPTTRFSSMPVMAAPVLSVPVWATLLSSARLLPSPFAT